jgi:hypothetical protein
MKCFVALVLLWCSTATPAAELAPFTSDGCSSFPNGTPQNQNLWLNCCVKHDLAYWQGGTEQQRLDADLALEQCVANTGERDIAKLMMQGVRAGGRPLFPTPYRWGYGWPFGRGYQALTAAELTQVKEQLESLQIMLRAAIENLSN